MKDPREASDECLMRRYADGDQAAFDELFRRYDPRAYAFFYRRTNSGDRAEDLYQELFLRLHRSRTSYDPARAFVPWFFQIADRLLIDDLRRAFRSNEVAVVDDQTPDWAPDAEERMGYVERARSLLAELSAEERRVLGAAKVEGVTYAELARELGKSADAVKKLASRAMQRLRAGASLEQVALETGP